MIRALSQALSGSVDLGSIPAYDRQSSDIKDIQSQHFMVDILPVIQELYPRQIHELNVLDVGARTAAGTGLLSYLHHPKGNAKIRMMVDALDIDKRFRERALEKYPEMNDYIIKDIYDADMPAYDLVICSHTIEHVPEVEKFMHRVTELARDYAVFACPYNENLGNRYSSAPGNHINSIDGKFLEPFGPITKKVYDGMCFTGDLVVFTLKGKAPPIDGDFRALERAGKFSEATEAIERVLEHRTQFPTIWIKYANLLARAGKKRDAVTAAVKAVSLNSSDPALRFRLAQLLRDARQNVEAVEQAEVAWAIRKVPDYKVFLAEMHLKNKETDAARACLDEALYHKKTHPAALALLNSLKS